MTVEVGMIILSLDMENKQGITIFHLYRKDGTALFLHPFSDPAKLQDYLDKSDIIGKYGKEPRVEALTLFRNDLYRMIEYAVKSYVAEKKFIPRFLFSAGVFLVLYFLLSFAVRDPLPMVDEVLAGLAGALITYFFLNKRGQSSRLASGLRVKLRTKVDKIVFQQDDFITQVEELLQKSEEESRDILLRKLLDPEDKDLGIGEKEEARELLGYLEGRFKKKDIRQQEKILHRLTGGTGQDKDFEELSRWLETKKIDVPLFAVYTRVKKLCKKA